MKRGCISKTSFSFFVPHAPFGAVGWFAGELVAGHEPAAAIRGWKPLLRGKQLCSSIRERAFGMTAFD